MRVTRKDVLLFKVAALIVFCSLGISAENVGALVPSEQVSQQEAPTSTTNNAPPPEEENAAGIVQIDGQVILTVYEPIGAYSPEQRATAIKQRIVAIAKQQNRNPDCIVTQAREHWTEILCDKSVIMGVTDGDARMAAKSRQQLAIENAESIRQALRNYRREHSWRMLLRALMEAAIAAVVLIAGLTLVRVVRCAVRKRLEVRIRSSGSVEGKRMPSLLVVYLGPVLLASGALLRWIVILGLLDAYLTVTLSFFPATREISHTVTRWVLSQLSFLGKSTLDYLPNLLVIAAVILGVTYALRLIHLVFDEIRRGKLTLEGFYPEWADPTEKLVRILALVLATVVAFPYLPGAKSPAFQGITIFVGVLLSLGSTSAVANAVAGTILTYMRSFLVGDWVQMGDTTGEVIEKNLLVTRILTPKAEVITIPNATVMSGTVKNYSREAQKAGVIFYTTVTIGYDAPWRIVHELLINAALQTQHVLHVPPPFVLQRALNDFYVSYELNAYTDLPTKMLTIYSDLHQNIQDKFNEAGVEICSPHYASLRDGNTIAIPEQYVGPDEKPKSFRISADESRAVEARSQR